MSDQQWHVFYRTTGMQETKQRGFLRADFLADSAQEALDSLLAGKQNVLHARVYPGASALTVQVEWTDPTVIVKHAPHADLPSAAEVFGVLAEDWSSPEDAVWDDREDE